MEESLRRPAATPRVRGIAPLAIGVLIVGGAVIAGVTSQANVPITRAFVATEPRSEGAPDVAPAEPRVAAVAATLTDETTLIPAPAPTPAITAARRSPGITRPMVASQWVNMRHAPSRDAGVVLVVPPQALVQADSTTPGWRRVAYDGAVGWVAEQHLVRQNER
jgi:uncharacterized protein YgiM (DUF1202 family)